ncbi:MAG: hypothetical protein M3R24_39255 [Chloroflexota bacterium]|nr:hypothetical protein [Chloroflexota bacterium]
MTSPTLQYHQLIFDVLGPVPPISASSLARLAAIEQQYQRAIPGALREWYALETGYFILEHYSNGDDPVPLDAFLHPQLAWRYRLPATLLQDNLFTIAYENQGGALWAAHLNGAEDPPVWIAFNPAPGRLNWSRYTDRFSSFVYANVLDHWWYVNPDDPSDPVVYLSRPHVAARDSAFSHHDLDLLRQRYQEHPQTIGFSIKYRFSRTKEQYILITTSPTTQETTWTLFAQTEDGLVQLATELMAYGKLKEHWYCPLNEAGRRVLQRLHQPV